MTIINKEYKLLFEKNPDPIVLVGKETRIKLANHAFSDLVGEKIEHIIGRSFFEYVDPEDWERILSYHKKRRIDPALPPSRYQFTLITAKGERRIIDRTVILLPDGETTISVLRDITGLKKEVEYQIQIEKCLFEISSSLIQIEDIDKGINLALELFGKVLGVNRAHLFRISNNRMKGTHKWVAKGFSHRIQNLKNLDVTTFPWLMERLRNNEVINIEDVSKMQEITSVERAILEKQRIFSLLAIPIYVGGKLYGFMAYETEKRRKWKTLEVLALRAVAENISKAIERKLAEEALKESEQKYRSLVEQSLVGIYILREDVFDYVNEHLAEIFGYTPDELIGKKGPLDLTAPEDRWIVRKNIRRRLEGEMKGMSYTFRGLKKDGEIIHCKVYGAQAIYQNHPVIAGVLIDITAQKRLEAQLRQAQKMEAIGTLVGGIAHDFNNILTAIIGYTDFALLQISPEHSIYRYLKNIRQEVNRAINLISKLLAFSRKKVLDMQAINLNEILKDLIKLLERIIGEDIELKVSLEAEQANLKADPGALEEIFINLCTNARDAMPNGGRLTIKTRNVKLGDEHCREHSWAKPGDYVMLMVEDTGIGMDNKVKNHIFEPFFTTKAPNRGTGLGLAIVYSLVKQHKGLIDVESNPGKGSVFKIYLPIIEERVLSTKTSLQEVSVPPGKGTILVVEDEGAVRALVADILKNHGYSVMIAPNGEEAIKLCKGRDFDLIIMDLIMPKMSGRQAYQVISKQHPKTKFLFVSGYSHDKLDYQFIAEKQLPFISKPFTSNELISKVSQILRKQEIVNQS